MTATELFQAGQLRAALDAQLQDVRANPADAGKRAFLFELAAFAGDWDRARRQIDAITYPDPERGAAVEQYKKLLDAEDHRRRVFRDGVLPEFLIPPPEWVFPRLEAVNALRAGDTATAQALLEKSDAAAAPVSALLNGKPAEGLRDCDDLFGPVLEVFAHGAYYWLPLEHVESLAANPPKFPRDLLWLPVKLTVRDGPAGDAFLPTRYPGTADAADEALKLARATDWTPEESGPIRGVGLRVLLAGEEAIPVTELRELTTT
jgi:type VI secretion system protein ImpE